MVRQHKKSGGHAAFDGRRVRSRITFMICTDAALSEKGHEEAKAAGQILKESGFKFDVAYVSVLKRAIVTLW